MVVAPLPKDYTAVFKKPASKKAKKAGKKKGGKRKCTLVPADASSSAALVLAESGMTLDVDAWIKPYLEAEVSPKMKKRVHSAAYHKCRKLMTDAGRCDTDARIAASEAGHAAVKKWLTSYT